MTGIVSRNGSGDAAGIHDALQRTLYRASTYPFRVRALASGDLVAVSSSGDHVYLSAQDLRQVLEAPSTLPTAQLAELKSKFFVGDDLARGMARLLASRIATRRETVAIGPALHIVVPTLRCAHSCQYCQVSRALEDDGFTMSVADLDASCDAIFESPAPALTVEFQGGDPLLRFDLIRLAIDRITSRNVIERRSVRFVVASTLHQLDPDMCAYFKAHEVYLSTSIDGPRELHNRNRPLPARDSYERTVAGMRLARELIGPHAVSALMTTTRASLEAPEAIVDTYVELGFPEIFLRPLSHYGFALRNARAVGYSLTDFHRFYERAFERVLYWNHQGVALREVAASIALNKVLSPFDAGYVDLQSPTGAGTAVLVYNYDGYMYPSDEARMLAASGDTSLRLGRIGEPLARLHDSALQQELIAASQSHTAPGCRDCAYNVYCGPDPVAAHAAFGTFRPPVELTEHCMRHLWLFDFLFSRLRRPDEWFQDLAHAWAQPGSPARAALDA